MKIIYIVNARIPTEKAHGIQIMKMCEAFANAGNDVCLIIPRRLNSIKENPFRYYEIKENFKIKKLPILDLIFLKFRIFFLVEVATFFVSLFLYLTFLNKESFIYVRGESIFVPWFLHKKKVFWETHIKVRRIKRYRNILKNISGVVTVTDYYKKELGNIFNISSGKILVAPDGVDLEKFNINKEKNEIRKELNLPLDKKIILYTGHLYSWKGTQVLADSSLYLDQNSLIVFVGGTEKDVLNFKSKNKKYNNLLVKGYVPYSKIPLWQKASDVLILPNSAKSDISMYYTSPMKLFEYMAVRRPIVASNIPSIKEILNENNSVLVESDSPEKLAEGIKKILQEKDFADRISKQAFQDVQKYTWEKRTKKILDFIKK